MKLTKCQTIVMETLYDVATHEGGGIILKNKYHSPAYSLEQKGFVRQIDRFPYRPHYIITKEGLAYWQAFQQSVHPTVATVAEQEVNLDARNSG